MNDWQMSKQLEFLLTARKWEGNVANELVFGSVKSSAGIPEDLARELRAPIGLINVADATADDEDPDLWDQNFELTIMVRVEGDRSGEKALIGGGRLGGNTSSKGRGILEVAEEALLTVGAITGADGSNIVGRSRSRAAPFTLKGRVYMIARSYVIGIIVTDQRFYHPPSNFKATGGAGSVVMTWDIPPTRWDTKNVVLVRKTGSVPPANETDGTAVTLPSDLPAGFTDTGLAADTYSYSLFGGYDENKDGTAERFSGPVSQSGIVVT